jgi:cation diffusion facilitator CzcD-associated flavoprotein CzcO
MVAPTRLCDVTECQPPTHRMSVEVEAEIERDLMDVDVAIVGAGPYGLSSAAHLAHHGVMCRAFGQPMETWRHAMPAGMWLKSDGIASSLCAPVGGWTLREYCERETIPYADRNEPRVVLEDFAEYGLAFQNSLVPDLDTRLVTRVASASGGYAVGLEDGELIEARRVVLAVGITHFAYIPPEFRALGELITHSGAHRTYGEFEGKRVAVIGAGSSAIESASGLIDAKAEVSILARRAELPFWGAPKPDAPEPSVWERLRSPSSGLGPGLRNRLCQDLPDAFRCLPADVRLKVVRRHLGPVSGWWLRDKVMDGADVRTQTSVRQVRVDGDGAALTVARRDGLTEELHVDHVIAATGYSADIDRLPFIDADLRRSLRRVGTMPALSRNFESSVPGLYFVGAAAAGTFGPLLRFVVGAEFAAPRVASHLASRAGRRESLAAA